MIKLSVYTILFLMCIRSFAQVPNKINYQGVARDASGNPLTNQTIGLQFKISTAANSNFYNETQPAVPTNSFGLFSTKIGDVNPLPLTGWENLPVILTVSINDGSGFTTLQTQTLASVPYALYALSAGNALPVGTRDGQTLRWDSLAQVWRKSNNLVNDENRVSIGLFPNAIESKFHVVTNNSSDSAAVTAIHSSAKERESGIISVAKGSSANNTTSPFISAIFGAKASAENTGSGYGVGLGSYGVSTTNGIGIAGFGKYTAVGGAAIGVLGSTDPTSIGTNKFAGVFDRGGVLINDSLLIGNVTNPGNVGDVLTLTASSGTYARAKWKPTAAGTGPFTSSANYIHAAPSFTNNKIVFGVPYPAGGFPFQSRFTVVNSSLNISDTAIVIWQLNATRPALYAEAKGSGFAISAKSPTSITNAYAGFFDGGLISKGKNSLPTAFSFLVKDVLSTDLFSVRNDGFVGIGTSTQTSKLSIVGTNGSTGFPYSSSPETRISILNNNGTNNNYSSIDFTSLSSAFGVYTSAQIVSENADHLITNLKSNLLFLTRDPSNIGERMRINSDGKVGINTATPSALLDVNGSTKLGSTGTTITNLIHGIASFSLPSSMSVPGVSSALNINIAGINPGDRVYVTLTPNANTISHGVFVATAIVSVANNLELTLGALINGSVPAATNFTINYMIIKP